MCYAHILRELTGVIENSGSCWAAQMKELLLSLYRQSDWGQGVVAGMGAAQASYAGILRCGKEEVTAAAEN
jgi:hypothetical protein